jgi:GH25 family lysozyme M1 (1,4-beta-N-acetylmuramidase)
VITKLLDLSSWEWATDFKKIREETDIKGIITRASVGLQKDRLFTTYWPEMKKYNFICGSYHYFYNKLDAYAQANIYFDVIRNDPGDIICMDVEDSTYIPLKLGDKLLVFLNRLEQLLPGRKITIYTRASYWTPYIGDDYRFRKYNLWVAAYNGTAPTIPLPWFPGEQIAWQFSSKGKHYFTTALSVDLNTSNLSEDELRYKPPV